MARSTVTARRLVAGMAVVVLLKTGRKRAA
jgi:hypothetical protein